MPHSVVIKGEQIGYYIAESIVCDQFFFMDLAFVVRQGKL